MTKEDEDIDPRFAETVCFVEADDFARQELWSKFSKQGLQCDLDVGVMPLLHRADERLDWETHSMGRMVQVGTLDNRPVQITCFWADLNGYLVGFWYGCSQVVDTLMIDKWFEKHCSQASPRLNADAQNFRNVYHAIRRGEQDRELRRSTNLVSKTKARRA